MPMHHKLAAAFATTMVACAAVTVTSGATVYPPQCGGEHEVVPRSHPKGQHAPLAVGDSTMLLALTDLAGAGYDANAQGCREWGDGLALISRRKAEGTLPHMVVVALGADGTVTDSDIGRTLGVLCCTRLLVLVTPRELGGGSGSDAENMRLEAKKHPRRILLLDWVNYSSGHGGWFQPDGLHLTTDGANAFASLLRHAMHYAYPPKPKKPHHRRRPHSKRTPARPVA